jgi:hypothetical protein
LTKGTEEYAEAVRNANDVAMQLLETNKDLSYEIVNGQVIIDEESLKNAKKAEREKLEIA